MLKAVLAANQSRQQSSTQDAASGAKCCSQDWSAAITAFSTWKPSSRKPISSASLDRQYMHDFLWVWFQKCALQTVVGATLTGRMRPHSGTSISCVYFLRQSMHHDMCLASWTGASTLTGRMRPRSGTSEVTISHRSTPRLYTSACKHQTLQSGSHRQSGGAQVHMYCMRILGFSIYCENCMWQ